MKPYREPADMPPEPRPEPERVRRAPLSRRQRKVVGAALLFVAWTSGAIAAFVTGAIGQFFAWTGVGAALLVVGVGVWLIIDPGD